ncbi:pancreatic secretory granule membrane major glycoprotein GP2-like [Cebidichthys violaceus]|uniref:pancreatic secretory granule membrane major glycoprotein GP2-like n=1 Tax=Cebidichthys violaceus TaxID=271503 RepID=UPI0035CB6AA7
MQSLSCDLLRQPPFTACHSHTDPEPYVAVCKDTLCKYPAVDGLNCQFMEAYAKSCSLKDDVTLADWRSTVGCSAVPKASCLDQYCSDHEFCGEKLGKRSCLCRALFASKYKPTNALGEPTVCTQNSATVTLAGCLLQDQGIDYSVLHLNDPNCKGHMDDQTHLVKFSFNRSNACGAEVSMDNNQILYNNTIVTRNSSKNDVIACNDQIHIDFSCLYVCVAGWLNLVGSSTDIQLNQKVWLELKTEGLDGNMVAIVTDSCWATNQQSPDGGLRYDLVINGCPNKADQTVEGNGLGTSNFFSLNMFEFSGGKPEVYLHRKLELCLKQSKCAPTCSGGVKRKRRSSRSNRADGNPALITMAWSN